MKKERGKGILLVATFCSLPILIAQLASGQEPQVKAVSALLGDADLGRILWEKNPGVSCYPASLTKLMTALLVLEHARPDEKVQVPLDIGPVGGSTMGLKPGEEVTLYDLLAGMLLQSANDAAVVAAVAVAGSTRNFIRMMNQRAWTLGMIRTHFRNPHGLHHPHHTTTARDLFRLARQVLSYQEIRELVAARKVTLPATDRSPERILTNRNRLLWLYEGCDGVKTGYTQPAGNCLIASAVRDGWRLIAVVLKSPDHYGDAIRLLNFGFQNFIRIRVAEAGTPVLRIPIPDGDGDGFLTALASEPTEMVISRSDARRIHWGVYPLRLRPPIRHGQIVGFAFVTVPGHTERRIALLAGRSVDLAFQVKLKRFTAISVAAFVFLLLFQCLMRLLIPGLRSQKDKADAKRRGADESWIDG